MNLFGFSEIEILAFIFVLLRVSGMIMFFPFMGDNVVPGIVKIVLSLAVSFIMFPILKMNGGINFNPSDMESVSWLATMAAKETAFGLLMGFTANMLFQAVAFAAQLMGLQMGFGMANLFDPELGTSVSAVTRFYGAVTMLLFLAVDGHHMLIASISESFTRVGLGSAIFGNRDLRDLIIKFTVDIFVIGVKLSAPIVTVVTVVNVAMGIIAKAVPQMQVFVVSMTVNILVGFLVLLFSLPMFSDEANHLFHMMGKNLALVIRSLHG